MFVQKLMSNIFGFILLLSFSFLCKSHDNELKCYYRYLEGLKKTSEYQVLREAFSDTLSNWIENDIKAVGYLKNKHWIIDDAVFFNKKKDKVLLLLLAIDKDPDVELASIKVIGGEIIDDSWQFYYQSYPILYRYREKLNSSIPKAFKELSEIGINEISSDGYITYSRSDNCKINYDYINSEVWFADWMRQLHDDFLNSRW